MQSAKKFWKSLLIHWKAALTQQKTSVSSISWYETLLSFTFLVLYFVVLSQYTQWAPYLPNATVSQSQGLCTPEANLGADWFPFEITTTKKRNLLKSVQPSTLAANFHEVKKRLLFFCSRVKFAEAKMPKCGLLTNQIDVGKSMMSHQNFSGCISPDPPSLIMTERFIICSLQIWSQLMEQFFQLVRQTF